MKYNRAADIFVVVMSRLFLPDATHFIKRNVSVDMVFGQRFYNDAILQTGGESYLRR